ncbi:MAG: hypothetical protein QXH27_05305 [Candidatus Micrarchaeia archaeon]
MLSSKAVCISIPGDNPNYLRILRALLESFDGEVEFHVKCKDGMHYYLVWPKE